ncbi:MAG TPA: riboflavin biosynthesis protein RibF [Kiritimatiellia bacterium]|nr:riboflavin biosynthesis protein RibF [Kiritimatiellia bacterium]
MRIVGQFEDMASFAPVAMAVGMFDGVHRGHQILMARARERAEGAGGEAWVLSFARHPLSVLEPEAAPRMLCTTAQKLEYFKEAGMAGCLLLDFTPEFSRTPAERFLERVVEAIPSLKTIVAGENWRFGHRAAGDVKLLAERGPVLGYDAVVPPPVLWREVPISSTRIREAIRLASLREARAMLGRWPCLSAPVVHGLKRGRQLGFPTANLETGMAQLPPDGIYAGRARIGSATYDAAVYIPRDERSHPAAVEVHVLDVEEDLYGTELAVEFVERIRPDDRRFGRDEELIAQIGSDVDAARRILAGPGAD